MDTNYNRLFIDMDSFYASIEQQDNPAYANKPLIVVPCKTDYTCAISASRRAAILYQIEYPLEILPSFINLKVWK